jgi:hypothetical protein
VSIGADLADARRRAGLTVTQVSQRTCIRETIITSIERDDYCVCGGDFYARGHIRAIANVVGADPGPLISAYDAAHPAVTAPAADRLEPARPVRIGQRHRVPWATVLGLALVAALGLVAYHVITAPGHPPGARPAAAAGVHRPARHHPRPAPPAPAPAPRLYAHRVAIGLTAIEDCWVEFTTPGGGLLFQLVVVGGTSKRWVFGHAVDMTLGNPGGIRLTVDGHRPLPPGPAPPVTLHLGLGGKISR